MKFDPKNLSKKTLLELHAALLKPRMIESKMLNLLRQGKISKWFAGIGQEAISVGVAMALKEDEFILPMHRNLGVFTTRKVPLDRLFKQFQGKIDGYTKGRDRSFHFGTIDHHIVGMISHLGPQLCLADGIALGSLLKNEGKVTAVFTGDGGTSEGDFHEALNIASVWDLPVIFVIENNGYGLSTPVNEQFRCKQLADRGTGYGMEAMTIDGNNILEVYQTIKSVADRIRRKPRPFLIECMTFRMRGHEEASGTKYVPRELLEEWENKDPIKNYEDYLLNEGILTEALMKELTVRYKEEIEEGLEKAYADPQIHADTSKEMEDVYRHFHQIVVRPNSEKKSSKRFVDAVSEGLYQSMKKYENLVIMGQDVAGYGGVFKVTENFASEFGTARVRNTPLCESGILSSGLGLSIKGFKSVIEMQFADFVSSGFNPIVNLLAKVHYRWDQNADVVIRMPTGAGVAAGPFHSQSNEAWFFHVPGIKIVYPSTPEDAKGLLCAAIEDPNPVMFFEHKALYRSISEDVHDDYYTTEIGKAKLVRSGDDLTVISYGYGIHWAKECLDQQPEISADLIDLRSLVPIDWEAIKQSVKKTGKVIILHEDTLTGGIGGEISATIVHHLFEFLDAPVMRVASLDTPVPFAPNLEKNFLPKDRFMEKLTELHRY